MDEDEEEEIPLDMEVVYFEQLISMEGSLL